MKVMGYLLASQKSFINTDTWKFEGVAGKVPDAPVDVPFFLWKYGREQEHVATFPVKGPLGMQLHKKVTYKLRYVIQLNGVIIRFLQNSISDCEIQYRSKRSGADGFIKIGVQPHVSITHGPRGHTREHLAGVGFNIKVNGQSMQRSVKCDIDTGPYSPVVDFGRTSFLNLKDAPLACGLRNKQYTIMYKNRDIGKSYVLVCGPWGIILDNDFKFDAFVTLKAIGVERIFIDEFLATDNDYILSLMSR